jgi:hypothetical protein
MHPTNDTMARILLPVLIGIGCLIVALAGANAIATLAGMTPNIGDIVAFPAVNGQPIEDGTRLVVNRSDRPGCVLDLGVLRRSGGSLIVERRMTDGTGRFAVH